jgi:hypothetical protein
MSLAESEAHINRQGSYGRLNNGNPGNVQHASSSGSHNSGSLGAFSPPPPAAAFSPPPPADALTNDMGLLSLDWGAAAATSPLPQNPAAPQQLTAWASFDETNGGSAPGGLVVNTGVDDSLGGWTSTPSSAPPTPFDAPVASPYQQQQQQQQQQQAGFYPTPTDPTSPAAGSPSLGSPPSLKTGANKVRRPPSERGEEEEEWFDDDK